MIDNEQIILPKYTWINKQKVYKRTIVRFDSIKYFYNSTGKKLQGVLFEESQDSISHYRIILDNGTRIDLPLSYYKKSEENEIVELIYQRINSRNNANV